jgi:hypothetical protein
MGVATIPPLRGRHPHSRAEEKTGRSGRDDAERREKQEKRDFIVTKNVSDGEECLSALADPFTGVEGEEEIGLLRAVPQTHAGCKKRK